MGDIKKKDLKDHLNLCADCETRMKIHRGLRNFFQKRIERLSVDAPDRLKMRLSRSIRAFRAEWSR